MGLYHWLVGRRPPYPGTVPVSADAVGFALMALDRYTAPYRVRRATEAEEADVVAEWKIADPRWSSLFERADVEASLALLLWVHAATREVRCLQRSRSVTWRDGRPVPTKGIAVVRGRSVDFAFGVPPAFVETMPSGEMRPYRFVASDIRRPLETTVRERGWTWRGVGFGWTRTGRINRSEAGRRRNLDP